MRQNLKISIAAVLAAMLVAAPAGAATINLGGGDGGLLNLGGGGNGGNGLLNLGGSNNSDGAVTVTNNLLDDGTDPDATAHVDLDSITGSTGNDANAVIDLGGTGTGGGLLGLGGTGDDPSTVDVDLGGNDGTDANVIADLFGDGGNNAALTLNPGIGGGVLGGDDGTGVVLDLFGDGSGDGTGGTGGTGGGGGTGGIGGGGSQVASIDNNVDLNCFAPNPAQVDKLANRHAYTTSFMSVWAQARHLKIVEVGLCPTAASGLNATLAADANISKLQDYFAANPVLSNGLRSQGHSAGDVVAVDRDGDTLIVYVI